MKVGEGIEVSVVIPACGGAEDTRACLDALAAQVDAPAFEVVVVDNGSRDHTADVCAAYPFVRVVSLPDNLGFAAGTNRGLERALGRYWVVLNNDTMAAPSMLRLLHTHVASGAVDAVAPVSNMVKGVARIPVGDGGATPAGRAAIEAELAEVPPLQDVETLSGLCIAMHRDRWLALEGFDERFGAGNFEDDDLCLRLRLNGARLAVARRAFLHHRGHRTFDGLGLDYRGEMATRRRQFEDKWQRDPAGRAWCAWLRGDLQSAAQEAHTARTRYPRWPDGLRLRALGTAHPETRDALLRQFLSACPSHTAAVAELAVLQVTRGDREGGLTTLEAGHRHCYFSNDVASRTMLHLSHALLTAGDPSAALTVADDGIALDAATGGAGPNQGALHNARGAALLRLGQLALAEAAFWHADAQGCPEGSANAGIAAWELGDGDRARQIWRDALRTNPDNGLAHAHLAVAERAEEPASR